MYQHSRTDGKLHIDFIVLDMVCLQLAFILAYFIRYKTLVLPYNDTEYFTLAVVLALGLFLLSLLINSYNMIFKRNLTAEIISVGIQSLTLLAFTSVYLFALHRSLVYSRLIVYYTVAIYAVLDIVCRTVLKTLIVRKGLLNAKKTRSLLVVSNTSEDAAEILREIKNDPAGQLRITGVILTEGNTEKEVEGTPVVADISELSDYICREWVDEVLLFFPKNGMLPENVVEECAEMGVTVHNVINLRNVDRNKQFIEQIGNRTVLTTAFNYIAPYQATIKRAADIAGGIVGSIITIIIGIVIGPIIFISSPGPILFKQVRVGKNGKTFKILKFRSMYPDAEERKKEYMAQNRIGDGLMFKLDFDPRIIGNRILPDGTKKTGIGEFIRKTSLDEFPQFFNVLKGDMSLVGTRPPTLDEWEKYQYHHRARLAIKPGITGLWQVSGRSEITDFEEVVRLDTEYICNFRLSLDMKILFKTIMVLFQRKGAM
ncbi:MAG: sugar transferase [Oscillospiraceae bacterium]|nr:sugar transferase [Oscillospiraceae bacterium]